MLDQYETIKLMAFDGEDRYWLSDEPYNPLAQKSSVSTEYILKLKYVQLKNRCDELEYKLEQIRMNGDN